jgi:Ser/Thr protein kinase RdoA (MazF antagonist)
MGSLSSIPFLHPGSFIDAQLTLDASSLPSDLVAWAHRFRDSGRLAAWPQRDWDALLSLIDLAEETLTNDENSPRVVLTHGDFNPKNILIDPVDCGIAGLLDWEFAHAGSIHTDFGNVTRFERDDRLVGPMIEGFVDWAPGHIRAPFEHGRAMDLWALVEMAGRIPGNPVCDFATTLLLAQVRDQDLQAWPWRTARVDPADAHAVP